ncbi:MAG: hypothetical protein CMM48_15450 [Rhodospirillaceae bacterium]|nr:hypothetical protein [Rhodospirillaceae bacterium]
MDQILSNEIYSTVTEWRWVTHTISDGEGGTETIRVRERYDQWVDTSANGGNDTLQLGAGISAADLVFRGDGADLLIGIQDPANPGVPFENLTDVVRVVNWSDAFDRVETIEFDDGSTMDISGITPTVAEAETVDLGDGDTVADVYGDADDSGGETTGSETENSVQQLVEAIAGFDSGGGEVVETPVELSDQLQGVFEAAPDT